MSKFFENPFFNNDFFNKPFFKDNDFFKEPFFTGLGGSGVIPTNPTVPVVKTSIIYANNPKRFIVEFDQEMRAKGEIKQKIFIVIDGGAPLIPTAVSFTHHDMICTFLSEFKAGQVVTWSYDDTDPTIVLESVHGVKADNQTYAVDNKLATTPPPPPADDDSTADISLKKKKKKNKKKDK